MSSVTLRLADALQVRSVVSVEYGPLLHLRVRGQDTVLVSLPRTVAQDSDLTLIVSYDGRLSSQDLDVDTVAVARDPGQESQTLFPVEPHYLLSNRTYWYPQNPVWDFATATIRVTSGTYDGGCRTYNPTSDLGTGDDDEGQDPAFRVENGATLRNAILGNNGVDGVHFYNGGNLQNFRWTNVGEDAFTIKSSGTVNVSGVTGVNSEDKFAQVNAASTLNVSNCIVDNAGKFLRQNGGTTFAITVNVDRCRISNMGEGIFRTDSSSSTARLTNSQLRNSGSMCIGPWRSCTGSGNSSF